MLWTPGYWGWGGGFYRWHSGYWGPHVGFYGGINYGFGYGGVGFFGGEWRGGAFFYNRSVVNVNVTNVTNVEHEHAASQNRQLFASENHGRPAIAATGRPGDFSGRNVVRAKASGEPYHAPKMSPQEASVRANGSRGSNQPARNGGNPRGNSSGNSNDRGMTRPVNHESRNNQPANRAQMSARDNPRPPKQDRAKQPERQAPRQEKQPPRQAQAEQRPSRPQPRPEPKHNGREQHR
jgi:hypothetical protein